MTWEIFLHFTENSNQDEVDCLRKPGSLPDLAGPQIDHLIKVSCRDVVYLIFVSQEFTGLYVDTTCTLFDKGDMEIKDI